MRIMKFVSDLFMGPDGETWAIGRFYSIPIIATGVGLPFYQAIKGQNVSLSELAVLLPAAAGGAMLLITGTNHVDTPGAGLFSAPKAS